MANEQTTQTWIHLNEIKVPISLRYPEVQEISFETLETNGIRWNRADNFKLHPESKTLSFILLCPFAQCYGHESFIDIEPTISEMIEKHAEERIVRLSCKGKSDRSLHYSCDWYIIARIRIKYRASQGK